MPSILPGPIPRTVFDPGAIWVLPASLMTQMSRSKLSAFLASSSLQNTTNVSTLLHQSWRDSHENIVCLVFKNEMDLNTHIVSSFGAFTTTFGQADISHSRNHLERKKIVIILKKESFLIDDLK